MAVRHRERTCTTKGSRSHAGCDRPFSRLGRSRVPFCSDSTSTSPTQARALRVLLVEYGGRPSKRTIGQVTSSQSAGDAPHCVLTVLRRASRPAVLYGTRRLGATLHPIAAARAFTHVTSSTTPRTAGHCGVSVQVVSGHRRHAKRQGSRLLKQKRSSDGKTTPPRSGSWTPCFAAAVAGPRASRAVRTGEESLAPRSPEESQQLSAVTSIRNSARLSLHASSALQAGTGLK